MIQIKIFNEFSLAKLESEANIFLSDSTIKWIEAKHSVYANFSGATVHVLTITYKKK